MEADQFNQWIRNRRSTFIDQFEQGKKIPDAIIMELLENANTAPTHKRTEPWRFTVYTDKGLDRLATLQAAIYRRNSGEQFKETVHQKLLSNPGKCSHIIAIGLKRNVSVPLWEEIAAVACAVENIYLSLAPQGIGGYWGTGGITGMEEAKTLLNLEAEDLFLGFLYLGYVRVAAAARTPAPATDKIIWVNE